MMTLPERFGWLRISSLWAYRILTAFVLAIGLAFAGMVLGLRYWILPKVESYREDIARIVSERARQKVTIGSISAGWDGLRPQLVVEQVTVYDTAGRPALELARIDNTLSWTSVLARELRFYALDIYRPTLNIRRDERGTVSIGGIEVAAGEGGGGGGFAEWLLRQRDVEIHDATIIWNDEQRKAPRLELKNVSLQLFNRSGRHRFGVRATRPGGATRPARRCHGRIAQVAQRLEWRAVPAARLCGHRGVAHLVPAPRPFPARHRRAACLADVQP